MSSAAGEIEFTLTGPLEKNSYANYLKMESIAFKHLFQPALTPYPGKISSETACAKEFLPREEFLQLLGQKVHVSFVKAGARKTFGVCAKADAVYEAAVGLLHLANGYALKFAAFVKPPAGQAQLKKLLTSFSAE